MKVDSDPVVVDVSVGRLSSSTGAVCEDTVHTTQHTTHNTHTTHTQHTPHTHNTQHTQHTHHTPQHTTHNTQHTTHNTQHTQHTQQHNTLCPISEATKTAADKEWDKLHTLPSLDCLYFHQRKQLFLYACVDDNTIAGREAHLVPMLLIGQVHLECTQRESKNCKESSVRFSRGNSKLQKKT